MMRRFSPRKEDRFFMENVFLDQFIERVQKISRERKFPEAYNHTIYFNNDEHEVPFEFSVKARRYSKYSIPEVYEYDPSLEWIFEMKSDVSSGGEWMRKKEREGPFTVERIVKILEEMDPFKVHTPIEPMVGDEYERKHFEIGGDEDFRVTMDIKPRYFKVEGCSWTEIGTEHFSRIELKVPGSKIGSGECKEVYDALESCGAEPIVSKKDAAYNFLGQYLRWNAKRMVPKSDTEIEAKLDLDGKDQHVFSNIYRDFKDGKFQGFRVAKYFPFIIEGGKIHVYFLSNDGENVRISVRGDSKRAIKKTGNQMLENSRSLDCILKRREVDVPITIQDLSKPTKMLYRKRKYFLVENESSNLSYCILMDRAMSEGMEMFQIEVEYISVSPTSEMEMSIAEEIATIVGTIIERYPARPSNVIKRDWIESIPSKK